jgi:hypothetical protein
VRLSVIDACEQRSAGGGASRDAGETGRAVRAVIARSLGDGVGKRQTLDFTEVGIIDFPARMSASPNWWPA